MERDAVVCTTDYESHFCWHCPQRQITCDLRNADLSVSYSDRQQAAGCSTRQPGEQKMIVSDMDAKTHLPFVQFLFYLVVRTRIDPDALATHLEVALSCAPLDTLAALQDTNSHRRRRATFSLAQHLADRLGCFEITGGVLRDDAAQQASRFQEVPRAES